MSDILVINLTGAYQGWTANLRRNISARILLDLQSGEADRQFAALKRLVASHNFKDIDGNVADDILDAPVEALTELMTEWGKAMSELPKAQG
jgi:hypothetical protein